MKSCLLVKELELFPLGDSDVDYGFHPNSKEKLHLKHKKSGTNDGEIKMERKTCDHIFKFRIHLDDEISTSERLIKTNVDFFEKAEKKIDQEGLTIDEYGYKKLDMAEDMVDELVFTKEEIQKLKEELCKRIMESENPFNICCVDLDGGYYYEDGELLEDKIKIE